MRRQRHYEAKDTKRGPDLCSSGQHTQTQVSSTVSNTQKQSWLCLQLPKTMGRASGRDCFACAPCLTLFGHDMRQNRTNGCVSSVYMVLYTCGLIFRPHTPSLRPPKGGCSMFQCLCCPPPSICNGKRRRLNDCSSGTKSAAPRYSPQYCVAINTIILRNIHGVQICNMIP